MQQMHNCRTAGHLARDKTLNRIRAIFYWPGMSSDVERWCQTCLLCQKRKPGPGVGTSPMQHATVYGPMECVTIDIMGPLPITDNGNQYLMVVADYIFKMDRALRVDRSYSSIRLRQIDNRIRMPFRYNSQNTYRSGARI